MPNNEIILSCIQTMLYYFKNKQMPEAGPFGYKLIEPNLSIIRGGKSMFCLFPCCCYTFQVPDTRICFDNKENRDLIFDYFEYWKVVIEQGRTFKEHDSASDRFLITFRNLPSFNGFQDSVPEYFRRMSRETEMQKYLDSKIHLGSSSEEKTPLLAAAKFVKANPKFIDNDDGKDDSGTCMERCRAGKDNAECVCNCCC